AVLGAAAPSRPATPTPGRGPSPRIRPPPRPGAPPTAAIGPSGWRVAAGSPPGPPAWSPALRGAPGGRRPLRVQGHDQPLRIVIGESFMVAELVPVDPQVRGGVRVVQPPQLPVHLAEREGPGVELPVGRQRVPQPRIEPADPAC